MRLGIYDPNKLAQLSQNSPWLRDVFGRLLFEEIRDVVAPIATMRPRYNPYLYENLLSDVSRLLDRCLVYRRECADLERQAINWALSYDLFETLRPLADDLNQSLTDPAGLQDVQNGQSATAGQVAGTQLAPLGAAYAGAASAAGIEIQNQGDRRTFLASIQTALQNNQDQLQLRHSTTGHALNFGERRQRVLGLITQDIAEAYEKAIAAKAGIAKQLQLSTDADTPFPTITGNDSTDAAFLDDFVMWIREILRVYERYSEDEVLFEFVIPVARAWYSDFTNPANDRVLDPNLSAEIADITKSGGLIKVALKDAIPSELLASGNVRLRGLGLSAGTYPQTSTDASFSWSAVVFLPNQDSPYRQSRNLSKKAKARLAEQIARPPIVLGRILPYTYGTSPAMSFGPEVWNADVAADNTNILVFPMAISGFPHHEPVRANNEVNDLKVHLQLVARASNRISSWTQDFPPKPPKATKKRSRRRSGA